MLSCSLALLLHHDLLSSPPLGRIISVLSSTLRSSSAKKAALDLIVVASRVGYAVLSFLPGSPARLALHRHIPSLALFYIPVARYRSNLNQSARSENDSIWREVQSSLSITLREAEVYSADAISAHRGVGFLSLTPASHL